MWKILKEMEIPDHLTCLLRNLYAGQDATLELDMERWTASKLGKEYVKAVYCHPAYLIYKWSTSRLNTVTLLIELIFRVNHAKCWAG